MLSHTHAHTRCYNIFKILSSPVEVLSESTTHTVESNRIDAAVGERETETQDTEVVPEWIVFLLRVWVDVKPQHEDVLRKETNGEYNDESHHHLRHLFTCQHLLHLKCSARRRAKEITRCLLCKPTQGCNNSINLRPRSRPRRLWERISGKFENKVPPGGTSSRLSRVNIKDVCYLTLHLARYIPRTVHEMPGHQHVEDGDDAKWYHVEDEEARYQYHFRIVRSKFLGKRIAHLQSHIHISEPLERRCSTMLHYVRGYAVHFDYFAVIQAGLTSDFTGSV